MHTPSTGGPERRSDQQAVASSRSGVFAASADTNSVSTPGLVSLYIELTKARLSSLVLVTAAAGFAVANGGSTDWGLFIWTMLGTAFAAFGANVWNQYLEMPRDVLMNRTRNRPLPSGNLSPAHAMGLAMMLSIAGPAILAIAVNMLTAWLGLAAILIYVAVYTPLKTRSTMSTLAGAVCGAIPPMMGWTAVTNTLSPEAWLLGAILFVWQIPHFMALAWLYREDYQRGGFKMLPLVDPEGEMTCRAVILYSLALIPLTIAVTLSGLAGYTFLLSSVVLGTLVTWVGLLLYKQRSDRNARRVFLASVIYLPLLLAVLVMDQGPATNSPRILVGEQVPAAKVASLSD